MIEDNCGQVVALSTSKICLSIFFVSLGSIVSGHCILVYTLCFVLLFLSFRMVEHMCLVFGLLSYGAKVLREAGEDSH